MKIKEIMIEHFRGIKKARWKVDQNLSILAGPNNSGKTTMLKAIDLFFSDPKGPLHLGMFAPRLSYYSSGGSRMLTKIRIFFDNLSEAQVTEFKTTFLKKKNGFWVELRISRGGIIHWRCSGKEVNAVNIYEKVLDKFSVLYVPVLRIGERGLATTEAQRLHTALIEVLVRVRGRESNEQKTFRTKINSSLKSIKRTLDESWIGASPLLSTDLKLKTRVPGVQEVVERILEGMEITTNSTGDLEIKDEGTGIQSLMAIGLVKNFCSKKDKKIKLVLLEEPEAFLHPQLQRKLAEFLYDLSKNAQIFVTTHSSVIIDSVDLNCIASLPRHLDGLEWAWDKERLSDDENGRLGRFCDAKNSELVFATRAIFCEGITDRNVILELVEALNVRGSDVDGVSVIEMGGKDTISKFALLARRFNIKSLFVVDRDFYRSGNRDSLKKLVKDCKFASPPNFYNVIDEYGDEDFSGRTEAIANTAEINKQLAPLNVIVLSSDIEGAVLTSFAKEVILDSKEISNLKLLSPEKVDEARSLTLKKYHEFILDAVGSKGWVINKKKKSVLKPHILAALIRSLPDKFVKGSDLSVLKKEIKSLIK